MAIYIPYDPSFEDKIKLGYSEGTEVCHALWALTDPSVEEWYADWIEEMRSALPAKLFRNLREFGGGPGDYWRMPSNLLDELSFKPLQFEIARIRLMTELEVRSILVPFFETYTDLEPKEVEARDAINKDPLAWRDSAVDLLESFQPYFLPKWRRLQQVFNAELVRIQRLRQQGQKLYEWLPPLDPKIAWNAKASQLVLAQASVEERYEPVELDEVGVGPTFFGAPNAWHLWEPGRKKAGVWFTVPDALGSGQSGADEADLEKPMHALADPLRLKIVSSLTTEALSIQDLAENLKSSGRSVANHIRVLEEAHLVRCVGVGNGSYSKYEADPSACRALITNLERTLAMPLHAGTD